MLKKTSKIFGFLILKIYIYKSKTNEGVSLIV